ncbi:MAG: FMN-binding protein [Lachnospiraceae bacterium]|nr:FMN-binding protein [Lachnospiraceae bacterium]
METENKYRGVATLIVVLFIAFFVVMETKLLVGGGSADAALGANGYNAGEYTGTGNGNNGQIKVKVTFSDTEIESVEILEHSESAGICEPAIEQLPGQIISAQSFKVDAVSGATMTSNGIMQAVKDAMSQAAK